jgi:hypothetical protein
MEYIIDSELNVLNENVKSILTVDEGIINTIEYLKNLYNKFANFVENFYNNIIKKLYEKLKEYAKKGFDYLSVSCIPDSISDLILSLASLNSRIPRPNPLINSGIFFPPNNNNTAKRIKIHSEPPGIPISNVFKIDIFIEFILQIYFKIRIDC